MSTATSHNPLVLPDGLPVPQDDGAARHLTGRRMPDIELPATDGSSINLSKLLGRTVLYIYPRTGEPGKPPPDGWDAVPGARGCTPQSCYFVITSRAETLALRTFRSFDADRPISVRCRASASAVCNSVGSGFAAHPRARYFKLKF